MSSISLTPSLKGHSCLYCCPSTKITSMAMTLTTLVAGSILVGVGLLRFRGIGAIATVGAGVGFLGVATLSFFRFIHLRSKKGPAKTEKVIIPPEKPKASLEREQSQPASTAKKEALQPGKKKLTPKVEMPHSKQGSDIKIASKKSTQSPPEPPHKSQSEPAQTQKSLPPNDSGNARKRNSNSQVKKNLGGVGQQQPKTISQEQREFIENQVNELLIHFVDDSLKTKKRVCDIGKKNVEPELKKFNKKFSKNKLTETEFLTYICSPLNKMKSQMKPIQSSMNANISVLVKHYGRKEAAQGEGVITVVIDWLTPLE